MIPRSIVVALILSIISGPAAAAADPIVGTWDQVDEDGDVGAVVAIAEKAGRFEGRIVKLFPGPDEPANPVCDKCRGARHNVPVLGMTVIEGLRREGDHYAGGTIVDPDTGSEYRLEVRLGPDGRTLAVRAFTGVSLFGRTQTWRREP
jgi:uncharacterized protein (DUF2147 family)